MNKIRKITAFLLFAAMTLSFAGCGSGSGNAGSSAVSGETVSSAAEKDGFNFADYLGYEIVDITKVDQDGELDSVCATYRFIFLSDGYKIKGFISIPLSCIETRTPCKCIVYCRGGQQQTWLSGQNRHGHAVRRYLPHRDRLRTQRRQRNRGN